MSNAIHKYAVIINGDPAEHHLKNVEDGLKVLSKEGYETFVISAGTPKTHADHYVYASRANTIQTLAELKSKIGKDDELVIYTTGHGDDAKVGSAMVCLADGCIAEPIVSMLDAIPYGKRTVIVDQCYSGNWGKRFTDDPKTLFISAGGEKETVACGVFSTAFWSEKAPDANSDGIISWQERYAYTMATGQMPSLPQFVPSMGYVQPGRPAFPNAVQEVTTVEELNAKLATLRPGQYAILVLSADWCSPCKIFKPEFDRLAQAANGQHLFLRTENENLARDFGVTAFPQVMIIDHEGNRYEVRDRDHILEEISQRYPSPEQIFQRRVDSIRRVKGDLGIVEWGNKMVQQATLQVRAGKRAEAVAAWTMAIKVFQEVAEADRVGLIYNVIWEVSELRDPQIARALYPVFLTAAKKEKTIDKAALLSVFIRFLAQFQWTEDHSVALAEAYAELNALPNLKVRAQTFSSAAEDFGQTGHREQASDANRRALQVTVSIKDEDVDSSLLAVIAHRLEKDGSHELARATFSRALSVAGRDKDPISRTQRVEFIQQQMKEVNSL